MTPRPELLLESRLCVALMPIIRRQRHSPNVLRFLQIDSAVSRSLWIDVHDIGYCAFVCGQDVNPDFHAHAQRDGSENQGTVEIDCDALSTSGTGDRARCTGPTGDERNPWST